jgi:hypothetical protein
MTSYDYLLIGAGNLILARQKLQAATDQEATATARDLFGRASGSRQKGQRFEVWGDDRRV